MHISSSSFFRGGAFFLALLAIDYIIYIKIKIKIKQIITNQRFLKRTKQKKVVCGSSKFRERENKLFKN